MKAYRLRYLLLTVLVVLAAWFISRSFLQLMLIQGESMEPSYRNMQLVLLDKYSEDYGYGDVVAFRCDGISGVLVKRVAALPGDTVFIQNDTLLVNGTVSAVFPEKEFSYGGIAEEQITLKSNQYFVIGDNVEKSKDSRYEQVGLLRQEQIIGKILGT